MTSRPLSVPVMLWGGSPTARQPTTWPPPSSLTGYWPPPPPASYPAQSFSTPIPPSGQGYWPLLSWAPLARGQAPSWGMPPWTTSQPQRPSSSLPTISHLCKLSIVPFVIRANVEWLAYSSIYVFKHPSSSAGRDFIDTVLNMGGSDEGYGGGTGNDAASWSSCGMWCICVVKW
jgi:hypothetical protein